MSNSSNSRWRPLLTVGALAVLVAGGCSTSPGDARDKIRERIEGISVEQVLEDLRDCDTLGDTFVELVRTGAQTIDELAETSEGRVPETQIREVVDKVAAHEFYEFAERLGCDRLQSRLRIVDQLQGVDPSSPEGADFIEEILRQVESAA